VLLGQRRGDNNQLLALAEGLGIPFETRTLSYRSIARMWMKLFPKSIRHVEEAGARWLTPPWPDLVIGIGRRSVAVARWIQQQSGDRARIIRLGHPRAPNRWFDLVITTRQYPVPADDNVLFLPLAMTRFREAPEANAKERAVIDAHPRPHLLVSLGGKAPMWKLERGTLDLALETLEARVRAAGGTVFAIPSPRTGKELIERIKRRKDTVLLEEVRYPVALADADEQFVTADSVSMISEAIMTGKPVGLIPVRMDRRGRHNLAGDPTESEVRDPRRFWADVEGQGLVGTVDKPRAGKFKDPVALAVAAVRERLGSLFD